MVGGLVKLCAETELEKGLLTLHNIWVASCMVSEAVLI